MEKQFLKRKLPNLIIIEGFWNIGKTSLLDYVAKLNGLEKIEEPDHIKNGIKINISAWYKKQHQKRMKTAFNFLNSGKRVIMERSLISNIAYKYACDKKLSQDDFLNLNKIKTKRNEVSVIFLYADKKFVLKQLDNIADNDTKTLFTNEGFYKKYIEFYTIVLPKYLNSFIAIKVDSRGVFKKSSLILKHFYYSYPPLDKEMVECASIVPFYKDKMLLLYDHDYKHYVLPQGHREQGECLRETAQREMKEETGFYKLRVVKKIKKYRYNFPSKRKIIYKKIHVFLVEILSIKKEKKRLEKHENYSNKFFTIDDAIMKVRWPQDKDVITLSKKLIKKIPAP